jgi:CTD small phosphatase-like protein 2
VLDELDKQKRISHRLYRQHTVNLDSTYIKDLSKLGRDLSKTLIIDNVADNFRLQPENGLQIKNFEGDENDEELIIMTNLLIDIVLQQLDTREGVKIVKEKMSKMVCCN